jgi:hypothetical protein
MRQTVEGGAWLKILSHGPREKAAVLCREKEKKILPLLL